MAPVEAMALTPGMRVADVCAAPGGKSTQILRSGFTRTGDCCVANDIVGSRIKPLGENLERWGADLAVITNQEMSRLADPLPGSVRSRAGRCALFGGGTLSADARGARGMVARACGGFGTAAARGARSRRQRWSRLVAIVDLQHLHLRPGGKRAGDRCVSGRASRLAPGADSRIRPGSLGLGMSGITISPAWLVSGRTRSRATVIRSRV